MPRGVDLGAQLGEESGQVLDFVKDHKLLAVARQEDGGLGEHRPVAEALEVEEDGVRALGRDGAGESCLADLAWSEEYDAGKLGQPGAERSRKGTFNHLCILIGLRSIYKEKEGPGYGVGGE